MPDWYKSCSGQEKNGVNPPENGVCPVEKERFCLLSQKSAENFVTSANKNFFVPRLRPAGKRHPIPWTAIFTIPSPQTPAQKRRQSRQSPAGSQSKTALLILCPPWEIPYTL